MTRITTISPPGSRAGPGFEAPFDMLHACHERLERVTALLASLRTHLRANGADDQARQAAKDVMRYFDIAAPEHHRDEELHVFPVLLALDDEDVTRLVTGLQVDHQKMEARWPAARQVLEGIAEGRRGSLTAGDDASLDAFVALYAQHIRAEEEVAYPRAVPLLQGERLEAMSRDMMARRGVSGPK